MVSSARTAVEQHRFEDLLVAWLHDPPDKALDIRTHESRACRYLTAALGREVSPAEVRGHSADQLASAVERLPFPRPDAVGGTVVGAEELCLKHALDASTVQPEGRRGGDEELVVETIRELVDGLDDPQRRWLVLWRLLPERLARRSPVLARLPADTRIPDHTIWHHLDTTAAVYAALEDGHGGAFLAFSLGPVQSFIATARSARDLWTGSMILSWLTFQGMKPLLEELGPTALVYPSLRGVPLVDLWLRSKGLEERIELPSSEARRSPCLPNRFVAVVPWGEGGQRAAELAERCERSARDGWRELAEAVRGELSRQLAGLGELGDGWDRWWDWQVEHFFDVRTAVLPWREADERTMARLLRDVDQFDQAFPNAARVRKLAEVLQQRGEGYQGGSVVGRWQHRLELCLRSLEAQRTVRHVQPATAVGGDERVPPKCTLLGTLEQMGPAELDQSRRFWQQAERRLSCGGARLRSGERLSAVALVKRFAGPVFFVRKLELESARELHVADTATVAAWEWLAEARRLGFDWLDPVRCVRELGTWSGQWLHARKPRDEDADESEACPEPVWSQLVKARQDARLGWPPAYYAVLVVDGDRMGEWLRGERSPRVEELLHERLREYWQSVDGAARAQVEAALAAARPVTPALHAVLSEALTNFAQRFVPDLVRRHGGQLIYAGGDDVLALLPAARALACARWLYETFRRNWREKDGVPYVLMGSRATLSAGLAVVHHKEDLRFALQQARQAERQAKDGGRDALVVTVCRRSGEHRSALCPWSFVPRVEAWVEAFGGSAGSSGSAGGASGSPSSTADGRAGLEASDRWAYHLRAELEVLQQLPAEAVEAEIRRLVNRSERPTREALGEGGGKTAGDVLVEAFRELRSSRVDGQPRFASAGEALDHFVTLCQTASFLARGRDE